MLPILYLMFLYGGTCNLFAAGLLETGQNVIRKTRLVKVLDKYPVNWKTDWNCVLDFPSETCQLIRNQQIDMELVHIYSEELTCRAGWSASSPTESGCSLPCQADSYGENCALKCRCINGRNCDPVDGSCDCFDGFTGHDCSTRCKDGEFGPNCKNKTHICENRGTNHPVSGECLCPNGYRGETCEITCSPFRDPLCQFDCELCSRLINTDVCDPILETCLCNSGWRGLYCTEPCAPGLSGPFCNDFCCSGNGFCDDVYDRCLCLDGFFGDMCQNKCEEGFFGRDCKERCPCPSCHHVTGTCDSCPHGYFGDRCEESCPADRWGKSCNESCACPMGQRCDIFTGRCPIDDKYDDLTTKKWQSPSPGRTDISSPTTTRLADEGTATPVTVLIATSLLGILAIATSVFLLACICQRRSRERRKTFTTDEPPTRVVDEVMREKGNASNQRAVNPYHISDNIETIPPPNGQPPPEYSTLDPATANAYNNMSTYMPLNVQSSEYASIGQRIS